MNTSRRIECDLIYLNHRKKLPSSRIREDFSEARIASDIEARGLIGLGSVVNSGGASLFLDGSAIIDTELDPRSLQRRRFGWKLKFEKKWFRRF